jgi:hypothetical protein
MHVYWRARYTITHCLFIDGPHTLHNPGTPPPSCPGQRCYHLRRLHHMSIELLKLPFCSTVPICTGLVLIFPKFVPV